MYLLLITNRGQLRSYIMSFSRAQQTPQSNRNGMKARGVCFPQSSSLYYSVLFWDRQVDKVRVNDAS